MALRQRMHFRAWKLILLCAVLALSLVAAAILYRLIAPPAQWAFSSTEPRVGPCTDTKAVQLGLRFVPRTPGAITAIRFFKSADNEGPHTIGLFAENGAVLAKAPVPPGSSQGWQTATLSPSIKVTPGKQYTASYLAPKGCYAATEHGFDNPIETEYLTIPAGAGVFRYGIDGIPDQTHLNMDYHVDVRFAPDPSNTPRTTPTAPPRALPESQNPLNLPLEAWYGGPAYYSRFAKARAAGWDDPSFFPISVFFGKPSHVTSLKSLGINTYMAVEHDGSPISTVTNHGVFVLASDEWTASEIGADPLVVGWHISDECEMGYSGCTPDPKNDNGELGRLEVQKQKADERRNLNDGRFLQANFANGVLGSYWAPNTMPQHLSLVDASSVDKYAYTSPHVQMLLRSSPYWDLQRNPASAYSYGWLQNRMEAFMEPRASKPNWVFVETAKPNLTENGATTISGEQIEGAVWNAIINGASGIAYFQHNNNPRCGTYSLIECSQDLRDRITSLNRSVSDLAPVINSPTLEWRFGEGLQTSLKVHGTSAYILAMSQGDPGTRRFTLPPGLNGSTAEVLGESRTVTIVDGSFRDDFAEEYAHHIYRIEL